MLRKILIIIPLIFSLIMGSLAFLSPDIIGGILGVSADNAVGRGTMTGDFGALFLTGGWACVLALVKGKSDWLLVPISLLGITFIGRLFDILSSGMGDGVLQPMIVEAVIVAMLFAAMKLPQPEQST